MKAYLIDPVLLQVTEVKHSNDYKEIYTFIDCSTFECVQINDRHDVIYIDEEGMLTDINKQVFFMYEGYPQPLAGKGLVLGTNIQTGESTSPRVALDEVIKAVSFMTPYQVKLWAIGQD